jgi:chromosome segregation ATPase
MAKSVKWIVIVTALATTGAWAQFGNLLKAPALDTRKFDELNAKIDTVSRKYDEGTAQIFQSAEILFQFVDQHHKLPSLTKAWPEVSKALKDAKNKEQAKLAQEGLSNYLNELKARKSKCDTIWQDITTLSTLKRLLSAEELKLKNAQAEADTGLRKDREVIDNAKDLLTQLPAAITDLAGQLQKSPLSALKIKPVLTKLQNGKQTITEIINKAPDQVEVGVDLVKKIVALFAAP